MTSQHNIRTLQGTVVGAGLRVAVVVSRFNELITESLLQGALHALKRHGVADEDVTVVWVPGAFELPMAAKSLAQSGAYQAVVTLGCVIRGATPHFDYVCAQASSGIQSVSMDTGIPVIFGVLTTETIEQAMERAGTKAGNKGADAAVAAIEMATLMPQLSPVKSTP